MQTGTTNHKQYTLTIILLCIGYFIDFYDLTIFSASYTNILHDLFNLQDHTSIQLLYLKITNCNTAGIIVGGLLFGILGDKFGRTTVIRYSILLYSLAIIASCFTKSIVLFSILRFLSGAGLATEFATSSVLISEMLPQHLAARSTAWLYFCGILGGITATFLGMLSWKIMFLCGGGSGLILFIARKRLFESPLYLQLPPKIKRGNIVKMFNKPPNLIKTIKLALLITPFYFVISIMFILPNFMQISAEFAHLVHILLIGFFIGNLISTLLSNYWVTSLRNFRLFFIVNSLAFFIILNSFSIVSQLWFFMYAFALGLLGGGLPSIWIQVVAKNYGTNQRNTATNTLYIIGRSCSIGFNLLISTWIVNPQNFNYYCIITTLIITVFSIIAAIRLKDTYGNNINYME
ncbi:MAG: MFS transporter [Burkholderiales bacterium]|nr:MFS transporter [Burkholderiales bacterium]